MGFPCFPPHLCELPSHRSHLHLLTPQWRSLCPPHWGWRCYLDWQSRCSVRGCWEMALLFVSCHVMSCPSCRVMPHSVLSHRVLPWMSLRVTQLTMTPLTRTQLTLLPYHSYSNHSLSHHSSHALASFCLPPTAPAFCLPTHVFRSNFRCGLSGPMNHFQMCFGDVCISRRLAGTAGGGHSATAGYGH